MQALLIEVKIMTSALSDTMDILSKKTRNMDHFKDDYGVGLPININHAIFSFFTVLEVWSRVYLL